MWKTYGWNLNKSGRLFSALVDPKVVGTQASLAWRSLCHIVWHRARFDIIRFDEMALNIKWIRKSTWELVIDWSTWEIFFSCAGIDSVTAILCATQRKPVSQTRLMPQADTSLRLDWNRKTGTQVGCDWPHARHTVVLYHLVCSFLQKCSFLWIYQRKWYCLSLSTLLSLNGSSLEVFARVGETFGIPSTAPKSWFFHGYWVFSGTLLGHRLVQFHSCHFA